MLINEILTESHSRDLTNTILYHGGPQPISKFNIPPYGVFFTPHVEWAKNQYGQHVTSVRVGASKVYVVDDQNSIDESILDALFDRDYDLLEGYVKQLSSQGYQALQTITDSEMVCVFPGTDIRVIDNLEIDAS
jgi:hypothetical protein